MISREDIAMFKIKMKEKYDSFKSPTYCKCLNQKIYLNAQGFHHLLYDGSGKARKTKEILSRLTLIPFIPIVMKIATDCSYEKRTVRKNRKKDSISVNVEMWGMEAIVGKASSRIKVIVRREGNGQFIFWSIMRVK